MTTAHTLKRVAPRSPSLLDGVQVLQFAPGRAAAVAGRLFADLGARVFIHGSPGPGLLDAFLDHGKEALAAKDTLASLARTDLVLYEPQNTSDLPFSEEELGASGATVVKISPFGDSGPDWDRPATDLTLSCVSGIARLLTGQVDDLAEPPTPPAGGQAAFIAGIAAACGATLALVGRPPGQPGPTIDVSAQEALATLAIQELAQASLHNRAKARIRVGDGNGSTVCILPAQDGYVAISPREEHQWTRWLEVMGSPSWARDPRFEKKSGRAAHWDEVHGLMSAWSRCQDKQSIANAAQAAHVPSFPLLNPSEHLRSPQLTQRRFLRPLALGTTNLQVPRHPFGISLSEPPEPLPPKAPETKVQVPGLPLSGVRVLDFSWVIAGPTTTRYLAAMGADVIKVEAPGRGDPGRSSELHTVLAQDKRAIVLDLKSNEGADIARQLAERSDVVIENFATGVMERFGLGANGLYALNPALIYLSASGMGRTGPQAKSVAYGTLLQCYAGFAELNNDNRRTPRVGMAWLDPMCGLMLALATGAALHKRNATGQGVRIDFSMVEAMLWTMAAPLLEGQIPDGGPSTTSEAAHVPEGIYPALGDDSWFGLSITNDDEWDSLRHLVGGEVEAMGRLTLEERLANTDGLNQCISAWTRTRSLVELEAACRAVNLPGAAVASSLDLRENPHLRHRGFWETTASGLLPGLPWQSTYARAPGPAPQLGEHTDSVLRDILDYSPQAIEALRAKGVLG